MPDPEKMILPVSFEGFLSAEAAAIQNRKIPGAPEIPVVLLGFGREVGEVSNIAISLEDAGLMVASLLDVLASQGNEMAKQVLAHYDQK